MLNTRENFKTDAQYKRWLEYYDFFKKLQEIQKKHTIWYYSVWDKKFHQLESIVFDKFTTECGDNKSEEWRILEVSPKGGATLWVGASHDYNKKTDDYDFLYIDDSLKKLIKACKFKYYENEVFITKD
jgi:hypothetical protein